MPRKPLASLFLYSLFFILYSSSLLAAPPTAAPAIKTKAFIWTASSPTNHIYLLGSIHLATPDMYPLSPDIEAAFKSSPTLVVELDINKVDQAQMADLVIQTGMYTDGDTLDKHVSKETMQALTDTCKDSGLPDAIFSNMRPWLAAITLTELSIQKIGLDPSIGIDKHFLDEAQQKKIVELESAESQLKVLSGFTDKQQEEWLTLTTTHLKDLPTDITEMVKLWKAGDAPALKKLLDKDYDGSPDSKIFNDALIDDRNGPMTDKIQKLLDGKSPAFVVVGAAHLIGEKGILALLKKKGYKIQQMELTPPPPATQP